jgi:hypothetical protein
VSAERMLYGTIREIADPLIAAGEPPSVVRDAVLWQLRVGIGTGGGGPDESIPPCKYCGAYGGGGHGGFCPNGGYWSE